MAKATEEKATNESPADEAPATEAQSDESVEVSDAELPQATGGGASGTPGQIDILLDSTVSVSASLGEVEMSVRDALRLSAGSVVKLERKVGESIDLYLRGVHFAKGKLVVVGEHLGVRVEEILSAPEEEG